MASIIKLVSSDAQLARQLQATGMTCVAVAAEAISSLAQPAAQQPAVLVIDLRNQSQVPPALGMLKRHHPTTGVLLVVSALDPNLMLEAMRAGVSELITDPIDEQDLRSAIKRLVKSQSAATTGDIFAFIGAKGGVGTTTIAVNVASALARKEKGGVSTALLVDLNAVCGDAAVFLGVEPRFSVTDALENVQRLDTAFFKSLVAHSEFGLDLLGASGRPATGTFDASRMRALLDFAAQTYQYTVLDVPRSDAAALDALEGVSKIVLVVNQELATVRNASRMAAALRERYGLARLALVMTRTDRRAEIGVDDVVRAVGIEIGHSFPSDYRLALQAMNKGRPMALDPQSELSAAFLAFARELTGVVEAKKESKPRVEGIFGRLSPRKA